MAKTKFIKKLIERFALILLHGYRRLVSPLLVSLFGPSCGCRHQPTCSCYAEQAIKRFGLWRGLTLAMQRILRCHPWSSSGYDPVPDTLNSSK